jgi:hypothetical protein
MKPITHLTAEQHRQAARLLNQAQDNLGKLTEIVERAPYTDQTLRCMKAIQEILINPLSDAWNAAPDDNPYQSVGYGAPHAKRFMQRLKAAGQA